MGKNNVKGSIFNNLSKTYFYEFFWNVLNKFKNHIWNQYLKTEKDLNKNNWISEQVGRGPYLSAARA